MLAYAIHSIRRRVGEDRRVEDPGSVFETNKAEFGELFELGAVREPTDNEVSLYRLAKGGTIVDSKPSEPAPTVIPPADATEPPVLSPKHKGGGKWVVVDADDKVASGEDLFDNKEAAQAWIDAKATDTSDLLG